MSEHTIRLGQQIEDLYGETATIINIDRVNSHGLVDIRFEGQRFTIPVVSLTFRTKGRAYFDNIDLEAK